LSVGTVFCAYTELATKIVSHVRHQTGCADAPMVHCNVCRVALFVVGMALHYVP